jgi:hypothetical protein
MAFAFPKIRVGPPIRHQVMSVFPLFAETSQPIDYRLSEEAITSSAVIVQEVGEQGTVPELIVENKGETRVLFLEGEQLVGAKQNRVLNTSILVPAGARTLIPVSCVEQGRWRHTSQCFGYSKTMSPSHLRHTLKGSVTRSLRETQMHRSDQGAVWAEVSKQQCALDVDSATVALSDTFTQYEDQLAQYRQELDYVPGSSGLAVAVGARVVSFDLFDKPATCEKVWQNLLSGFVLDALAWGKAEDQAESAAVDTMLRESGEAAWEETPAVGEGQEYRAEFDGHQGSVLTLDRAVVHLSVLSRVQG